jgi:hypothetical protein
VQVKPGYWRSSNDSNEFLQCLRTVRRAVFQLVWFNFTSSLLVLMPGALRGRLRAAVRAVPRGRPLRRLPGKASLELVVPQLKQCFRCVFLQDGYHETLSGVCELCPSQQATGALTFFLIALVLAG